MSVETQNLSANEVVESSKVTKVEVTSQTEEMVLDENHYEDLIERGAHAKEVYFKRKAEIDEFFESR
ncbi:hypothetical protein [Brevibacillus sp. MS2.2]|uniref:hypothetical protein n=1 Tax=Brevibacillus sp. MS2.2 TaxID=2738981 RepID=UPI00156BC850|nr:hypothetical protein [Brevibacillus sp. MS2.2]NRR19743.1 hypothetical protein [Brevibacillus sp. MS2.2]